MPWVLDLRCDKCEEVVRDYFVMTRPEKVVHFGCGGTFEEVLLPRSRHAQWSDKDAVVVFKKPDGTFAYPCRNNAPTPPGCERVVMRSLREVEQHEKIAGVRNEAIWFDRGSGKGFDDEMGGRPLPRRRMFEGKEYIVD